MRNSGYSLVPIAMLLLLAAFLNACGSSDPDIEVTDTFNDSPLRASLPLDQGQLSWLPVDGVTEYRVTQTNDGPEVIPGGELLTSDSSVVVDFSDLSPPAAQATFTVEANDPEDGWVFLVFEYRLTLAVRTLQFDWDTVEGATQYRLTQKAGQYPLFPAPQVRKTYGPDQRFDRFAIPVHLFDWEATRLLLEAQIDGAWVFVGEQDTAGASSQLTDVYTESDPNSQQLAFGWTVVLSENGEAMAVAALGETSVPVDQRECPEDEPDCDLLTSVFAAANAGGVYVYDLQTNDSQLIKAPNVDVGDLFGRALAISDDGLRIAVSALGEDSDFAGVSPQFDSESDNENATDSGAVYIFSRSVDAWVLEAYIKSPIPDATDLFGWSLDLSGDGNTLAISAVGEDGIPGDPAANSLEDSGAVYLYIRSAEGLWTQSAYLKAANPDAGDAFGSTVTLNANGDYLAVASANEAGKSGQPDNNSLAQSGAVYIFAKDVAEEWQQAAYLKASNANAGDQFGLSLSFTADASLLAVGAPFEDRLQSGVVSVGGSSGSDSNVGAAYLFERLGDGVDGSWTQKGFYFKASNATPVGQFGVSVELSSSGNLLTVGAWGDRTSAVGINGNQNGDSLPASGAAYVFSRVPASDSWEQTAFVKAADRGAFLYFGSRLSLALDGELLAVAANGVRPDGGFSGFPGRVYLY